VLDLSYYELWNVLSQWKKEFTVKDFASSFTSPDPSKVLFDMSKKGLLEKTGWGKYRVVPQAEYATRKASIPAAYDMVKKAELPYAFSGPDGVFFWTKGGYNVDRFSGFYPITLAVKREDSAKWQNFFRLAGCKYMVRTEPVKETLFGVFYVLEEVDKLQRDSVGGFSVEPLKDVVKFCQDNVYAYEPALEMLDEMYRLGLDVRYRESNSYVTG
jgi:hypothetical protein